MSKEATVKKSKTSVICKADEKQRKKEYREQRRNRRNRKIARCRTLKNFIFFIVGFFTSLILLFGGIFIGLKFIPLNTFVPDEVVKEDTIGSKSLLDAILTMQDYGMEDLPFVYSMFGDLLGSTGAVWLDEDEFKKLRFDDNFGSGFMNSLHISKDFFGELGGLDVFKTLPVPENENPETSTEAQFNAKLYYVIESGSYEEGTAKYVRAYTDSNQRVSGTEGKALYYLALDQMSVGDLADVFGDRFQLLKVKDIISALGDIPNGSDILEILGDKRIKDMDNFDAGDIALSKVLQMPTQENGQKNKQIYDILLNAVSYDRETDTYDTTKTYADILIGDLSRENFDINNVLLSSVIDMPTENNNYKNKKLYDVLLDASSYDVNTNTYDTTITYEDLKLGDLAGGNFNMDYVRLSNIIELPTAENNYKNKKLYDVLLDATSYDAGTGTYDQTKTYADIKMLDLAGGDFSIDSVRLCKVMQVDPSSPNAILDKLINDQTVNIGNLSEKINKLRLDEIFNQEVLTTDQTNANIRDLEARYSYNAQTGVYTLDKENGTYYISSNAKIWLFVYYNVGEADEGGYAKTLTDKGITFSSLESGVGDVADGFMTATIRQLYLCGILSEKYDNIMALTGVQVMEALNLALSN